MRRGTGLRSPESHAREHAEISVKLPWVSEHARNVWLYKADESETDIGGLPLSP
jgi:hypothetical protein